jgi:hypothetical protein
MKRSFNRIEGDWIHVLLLLYHNIENIWGILDDIYLNSVKCLGELDCKVRMKKENEI